MTLQIAKVTFPIWVSVNQCTPHFHLDIQRDLKHNIWKQVPHHLLQTRSFIIFFILLKGNTIFHIAKAKIYGVILDFSHSLMLSTMIYCWFSPYWDESLFNHNELTISHHFHHTTMTLVPVIWPVLTSSLD